mmetsp:Transcript_14517/g.35544  ORF Transcript_14517/g.35544 Transcript_14517/m.35544 type:complete len:243 (-) Transcript_14517:7-735(-)
MAGKAQVACGLGGCCVRGLNKDMPGHRQACDHRPYSCPMRGCGWEGGIKEVEEHLTSVHKVDTRTMPERGPLSLTLANTSGRLDSKWTVVVHRGSERYFLYSERDTVAEASVQGLRAAPWARLHSSVHAHRPRALPRAHLVRSALQHPQRERGQLAQQGQRAAHQAARSYAHEHGEGGRSAGRAGLAHFSAHIYLAHGMMMDRSDSDALCAARQSARTDALQRRPSPLCVFVHDVFSVKLSV